MEIDQGDLGLSRDNMPDAADHWDIQDSLVRRPRVRGPLTPKVGHSNSHRVLNMPGTILIL